MKEKEREENEKVTRVTGERCKGGAAWIPQRRRQRKWNVPVCNQATARSDHPSEPKQSDLLDEYS